jgi:hypothetical protein
MASRNDEPAHSGSHTGADEVMEKQKATPNDTPSIAKCDIERNDDVDLAARILARAHDQGPITQAEMDAVRWKIDWHMVPMLFVCLQLSGWDKVV